MATKQKKITKDLIISMYMNYALEHNEKPKSVYHLTKWNKIEEADFYNYFGTIESIEKEIFKAFLINTIELLNKNEAYESYDFKTKLLSFYYTFFEILSANRSFVVLSLNSDKNLLKNLIQLSSLRIEYKKYITEIITDDFKIKFDKVQGIQDKLQQESAWIQLLVTLKFWLDDDSASFEKTDVFIEKSINTLFDLMNTKPLESLLDFGKFIFKEKLQKS